MPVPMIGHDGEEVAVPDAEVQAAYESGKLGFTSPDAKIPIRLPDGTLGTIPAQHIADAWKSGATVAQEETHKADLESKYGDEGQSPLLEAAGIGHGTEAAIAGAARTLSLGGSDWAAIRAAKILGGDEAEASMRERLQAYKDLHPGRTLGGEAAGAILPALETGGGSLLGTGGALVDAVGGAGSVGARLAESAAARVGLEGLAAKAAGHAGRGLVEGAIYGAANAADDSVIKDEELTAEKLYAGGLMGAGFGAVGGALVGGGIDALAGIASRRSAAVAARAAESLEGGAGEAASAVADHVDQHAGSSGLSGKLQEIANEQRVKIVLNARNSKIAGQMADLPGGLQGVGEALKPIVRAGDSVTTLLPKIEAAADSAGDALTERLAALDSAGHKGPAVSTINTRAAKEILPALMEMKRTNKPAIDKLETVLADFTESMGGNEANAGFKATRDFRGRIDDLINWQEPTAKPANAALVKLRSIMEEELIRSGDEAATSMGSKFKVPYEADKLNWRRLNLAREAAERGEAGHASNRTFSASDHGVGGLMALSGHGLLGVGAGVANKLARERGNSVLAVLADKASQLQILRSATEIMDRRISAGVDGFLGARSASTKPQLRARPKTPTFEQAAAEVRAHATDPERHMDQVAAATPGMAEHAPGTSQALSMISVRAIAFLASKLPRMGGDPNSLQPHLETARLSPAEKAEFLRYVRTVQDPTTVLDSLRKGRVTRAEVETLKAVYPKLYSQIQGEVADRAATMRSKLTFEQRLALKSLFDISVDWSTTPEGVRFLQASASSPAVAKTQNAGAPGGHNAAPKRKLESFGNAATPFDKG